MRRRVRRRWLEMLRGDGVWKSALAGRRGRARAGCRSISESERMAVNAYITFEAKVYNQILVAARKHN
jgi:hypothetical protein